MTTITSTPHSRTPLLAVAAVTGALLVGGVAGVLIEQATADSPAQQAPAVSTYQPQTYSPYQQYEPQSGSAGTQSGPRETGIWHRGIQPGL